MTKLNEWNMGGSVVLLCITMAIAASAQTFRELATFNGNNGSDPFFASLVQGRDGNFYGTTSVGGSGSGCYGDNRPGCGTVFRISPAGKLVSLYSFCSQTNCTDGAYPSGGVVLGLDGSLYGTTSEGGFQNFGTIFKINQRGVFTIIHSFSFNDGSEPQAGLVQAADGNFYGSTANGPGSDGTVFKVTRDGILTTLAIVAADPNKLIQATDGDFYGTTPGGYGLSEGTVFKMTPTGGWTTLYNFCAQPNCSDGAYPVDPLVQVGGNFYGTTVSGAVNDNDGTVFEITPEGNLNTLYKFCLQPNCTDGASPAGGLVFGTDGNFYGTTGSGGKYCINCGTIFKITATGMLTTLHSFDTTDGAEPHSGLVQATSGKFYGAAQGGGPYYDGTLFSLDMGLGPFVTFVVPAGKVGQTGGILGQGFTGTTSVMLNGIPMNFDVVSDTYLTATVPQGVTTGYVTVATPTGVLTSNVPFNVIQ